MLNKNYIFILIASLIWGASFPAITLGLKFVNAELLLFLRFFVATIISFFLFPKSIKRLFVDRNLVIIGVFNGLAYLLQFIGQTTVPPGQSSILVNFYSVLVPILGLIILHEKPSIIIIIAVIIGFLGVILLADYQQGISGSYFEYLIGITSIFFAGVSWAFYVVFTKKFQMQKNNIDGISFEYSSQELFTASMFYTTLIAFFSLFFVQTDFSNLSIDLIFIVIYLSIFATVIAFILYLIALENINASKISIILLSEVFIAYFLSILFLDELVGPLQIIGSLFIISSILLVISKKDENKT
jgi:drug/metabolite transporter (DMT)-like permease